MIAKSVLWIMTGAGLALSAPEQSPNPGKKMHLAQEARSTIESYYQELESRKSRERTSRPDRADARTSGEKSTTAALDYQSMKSKRINIQIGEDRFVGVYIKNVEKKLPIESKASNEKDNRTAWERFQATTVTGTVEGDENSIVIIVLSGNGLNGSIKIPSEKIQYSLQGDSASAYQIKEEPVTLLKCGVSGNAK